jgi:hypothetical protein
LKQSDFQKFKLNLTLLGGLSKSNKQYGCKIASEFGKGGRKATLYEDWKLSTGKHVVGEGRHTERLASD